MKNLIAAIKKRSLEFGKFTLASGEQSDFYLDLRNLTLSQDVGLVAEAIRDVLKGVDCEAIGGPCIGADPIVGAVLHAMALQRWQLWGSHAHFSVMTQPKEIRGFLVRKEAKDHGKKGLVIGPIQAGDRCVVIEDVTTTGGSLLRAVGIVEDLDCKVVHAITIVDRQEGAKDMLSKANIPFTALVTKEDLGIK